MAVNADRNTVRAAQGGTGRVNNNAQGWGIAALVIALAVAANVFIYMVHRATYKHPTDPTYITTPAAQH